MLNDKSDYNRNERKVDYLSPLNRLSNERRHTLWRPYGMQEISSENTHNRNRESILGKLAREINERSIFSYLLDFHQRLDPVLAQGKEQFEKYQEALSEEQNPENIKDILGKAKESICGDHAHAIQKFFEEIKNNIKTINESKEDMLKMLKSLQAVHVYKDALAYLEIRIKGNQENEKYLEVASACRGFRIALINFPRPSSRPSSRQNEAYPPAYRIRDIQHFNTTTQRELEAKLGIRPI